jgi:predicted DNA-binding transcriptional regulator YafY
MDRPDRLIDLLRLLRDGTTHRARDMALALGVTQRTIYRDMAVLIASGVPVAGTRGTGYRVTAPVTLPALNLTLPELEALQLGLAVVAEAAEPSLRAAAGSLAARIDAALPEDRRPSPAGMGFAVYPFADAARGARHVARVRAAIRARQKLRVAASGDPAVRVIRPLRLDYWGRVWTVTVWCDTTHGFEDLRLDRIDVVTVLPELFVDEPGKRLSDRPAPA